MSRFLLLAILAVMGQWLVAQNPATYLKRLSDPQLALQSQSMCPTADGNFYLAGKKDIHPFIVKLSPEGEMLWMRSIPIGTPVNNSTIVEILEDSEGKIVFCTNQFPSTPGPFNPRNSYFMRFDPVGDTLIWFKGTGTASPTAVTIAENGPGGNFFLTMYKSQNNVLRSEIIEVNRKTGLIVSNAGANLYTVSGNNATTFQKIVIDQGNIYAAGGRRLNASSPFMPLFCKISTQTDDPEWNRIVVADTTAVVSAPISYDDMALDGSSAILLGSGFKDDLNTALGRYVYLGKHRIDGTLMWLKRYDFSMNAEDVLPVPDGYVIFGKMSDNQWGLLKTDKDGQLIRAKIIKTSNSTAPLTLNTVRQGQLIRVADRLLMTDFFSHNGINNVLLMSTDLNIGTTDSCNFVREVLVSQETMPAHTALLGLSKTTGGPNTGDAGVIYEKDSIMVCGLCPLSPCCEPDITAKAIDSVFCSSGTIRFGLHLCNVGEAASTQSINVTFYNNNPFTTAASALYTGVLSDTLEKGDCRVVPFDIDPAWFQNSKLYVLVGSKGDVSTPVSLQDFPLNSGFLECAYANNLDSITLALPPIQKLDLGPDRNICVGQSVTLNAGPGYTLYQWQGGPTTQTYTVKDEGTYILRVGDACGRTQLDTVRVRIVPQPTLTQNITLLPGKSVVIKGTTYKQATTFNDTIPSLSGLCDTIVTYNIRIDELHCTGKAEAFYQVNYKDKETNAGRVLIAARDGSIYTAGERIEDGKQAEWAITKTKPNGEILWSRKFEAYNKFFNLQMIEDSEGNLVGTLGQIEAISEDITTCKVFRYNPNTDQMLWMIDVKTDDARVFPKVLAEKAPGGNYILCYSLFGTKPPILHIFSSEYCELDRNSGQIIVGSVKQYGPHVRFLGGLLHQNKIILNGLVGAESVSSKSKDFIATIDLASGTFLQKKTLINTVSYTPAGGPAALDGDGNIITLMYSGDRSVYLRKNTLDGTPLWIKGYSVANVVLPYTSVGSVAVLSDGYAILYNIPIQNGQKLSYVLIKTDKNGLVQWSKKFAVLNVQRFPGNQSMQVSGDSLYITGATEFTTPNGVSGFGALLLKVDKDGNAGDNCDVFEPIPITQTDYSITVEPANINLSNKQRNWVINPDLKGTLSDLDVYTICSRCPDPCAITLELGTDRFICPGDSILLRANEDFATFKWQDGSTGQQFWATEGGTYHVEVKDKCGVLQRDTITVMAQTAPVREELVVLLPGESIVIAGKTYSSSTKFNITIPSKSGLCDTTIRYNIIVSANGCKTPKSFFKSFAGSEGRAITAAKDGHVYILGEKFEGTTLSKFDSIGKLLWAREIIRDITGPGTYMSPVSMIEDSEGMLTGCGRHSFGAQPVVFRYNPMTHQMLWLRVIQSDPNSFNYSLPQDIVEEKAGGDFLLINEVSDLDFLALKSEVIQLNRTTGVVSGQATRYESSAFRKAVVHGQVLYITGTFQDSINQNNKSGGVIQIDLATDKPIWTKRMTSSGYEGRDIIRDKDDNVITLLSKGNEFILQKNSPNGDMIWQRKYSHVNIATSLANNIRLLDDGDYALTLAGNYITNSSIIVTKIDKAGPVKWAKFIKNLKFFPSIQSQWLDVHKQNIYFTYGGTESVTTLFGKLDVSGDISTACQLTEDMNIPFSPLPITEIALAPKMQKRDKFSSSANSNISNLLNYNVEFRCIKCENFCDTLRTTKNITFYPGDTIVIDGKPYTKSGTVLQSFVTPAGCDSIVTNILTLVITKVDITCPADLTVTLPPNTGSTVVDYNPPKASTDCPDKNIALKLIQGLGIGGSFPIGVHTVCYEASNACGAKDTCCFKVTVVNPETACDIKSGPNCMRYELLSVKFDAKSQRRYRVRLSNSCSSPVQFAYIQSPNGVNAVSPAGGSVYTTAPAGRAYDVRNPNASPFASIRFKAQTGDLKSGASDIFEYTLPQQSAPSYILVAVRLENGEYYEAYLNTFNCPTQPYDGNRENEPKQEPEQAIHSFSVYPNPTTGVLYVNFPSETISDKANARNGMHTANIKLLIVNALGQIVFQQDYAPDDTLGRQIGINLERGLSDGMYQLSVIWPDGKRQSERFVLER